MSKIEKPPLPEEEDPVYVAICRHWPREVLPFVGVRQAVEHELTASGHPTEAGRLHEACERIKHAALHGEPPPRGDIEVVRAILAEHGLVSA